MMLQLNPPIPLITPKGPGIAWLVIDYGAEHNIMWTVAITSTCEVWTFSNSEVRADKNITLGRFKSAEDVLQSHYVKQVEETN